MLDQPKGRARSVLQIAATISNTLLGLLLLVAGALSLSLIAFAAIDIADQTWATLGERITSELGSDVAALFQTFQIDVASILSSLASQNNLPEFGAWVRQILALLMVASFALGLAGAAPLFVARELWTFSARRSVLVYGALLVVIGVVGLIIAGVPQITWGLVLINGLLTLLSSRMIRLSA
ncbi:MAG: hypothetical protein WCP88_05325 [bacterium]